VRKLLSILLTLVVISGSIAFAAPFPDLPADHWATEAVKVLAEKGLVEGYPNGTFKGDRAATRYEVAMVVARLVAYLEKRPQVTKEDLDAIRKLVDEYKDELDAMGVRLKNVEDLLASLEKRVTEVERVKWSGGFETRFVTELISTCVGCVITPFNFDGLNVGARTPLGDQNLLWNHTDLHNPDREKPDGEIEGYPFDKVYTAFPAHSGSALVESGYLRVQAKLSDEYNAGGVVSMYNNVGQQANGTVYGPTPNSIANSFQQVSGFTNLSANLNQIYVTSEKQRLNAAVGDWRPALISDHILQGLPNMGIFGPDYLPFYGGQLFGQLQGTVASGVLYEVVAGRIADNNPGFFSTGGGTLQNLVYGGALGYSWKDVNSTLTQVDLTGNFVRIQNDAGMTAGGSTGSVNNAGLWASPNASPFVTVGTTPIANAAGALSPAGTLNGGIVAGVPGVTTAGLGPQTENLYGADLKIKFGKDWKWLTLWGKYGNSTYLASRGANLGLPTVSGSLAAGGIAVDTGGRITGNAEVIYVQPRYDPFVAQIPAGLFPLGPIGASPFFGFPYPVSYGPLYSTVLNSLTGLGGGGFFNPGFSGPFSTTGGAGDVFYNIHDARKYPDNRTGFRGTINWNYGYGNVGLKGEYLKQTNSSSMPNEFSAGFYEPIFAALPVANVFTASAPGTFGGPAPTALSQPSAYASASGPTQGFIRDFTGFADYTIPSKELTLDGLYTDSRIKRYEPDFNNIDLHFIWFRGGATYRPTEKWSLSAGYEQFSSVGGGRYLRPYTNQFANNVAVPTVAGGVLTTRSYGPLSNLPPNALFSQRGPYVGVDYMFVKGANAWIQYHLFNTQDNNMTGFSGFAATALESGLRFTF